MSINAYGNSGASYTGQGGFNVDNQANIGAAKTEGLKGADLDKKMSEVMDSLGVPPDLRATIKAGTLLAIEKNPDFKNNLEGVTRAVQSAYRDEIVYLLDKETRKLDQVNIETKRNQQTLDSYIKLKGLIDKNLGGVHNGIFNFMPFGGQPGARPADIAKFIKDNRLDIDVKKFGINPNSPFFNSVKDLEKLMKAIDEKMLETTKKLAPDTSATMANIALLTNYLKKLSFSPAPGTKVEDPAKEVEKEIADNKDIPEGEKKYIAAEALKIISGSDIDFDKLSIDAVIFTVMVQRAQGLDDQVRAQAKRISDMNKETRALGEIKAALAAYGTSLNEPDKEIKLGEGGKATAADLERMAKAGGLTFDFSSYGIVGDKITQGKLATLNGKIDTMISGNNNIQQTEFLELQNKTSKMTTAYDTASNFLKKIADVNSSIVRNV